MVSVGTFTIDDQGGMSKTMFRMGIEVLEKATSFLLSIEPESGSGDVPSERRMLAGSFSDSEAWMSMSHGNAIGTDLRSATVIYLLATYTQGITSSNTTS